MFELLQHSGFVHDIELLEEPPPYYYDPSQLAFSFEDIEAIVAQFPADKKWTAQDLENPYIFPPDCPFKIEILNYQLYIMRPTIRHQQILTRVSAFMEVFAFQNNLGNVYVAPVGLEISEGTVLEPDFIFVSVAKKHIVQDDKKITEAPDLVVEVISPSNYKKLREEKKKQYAAFGIEEYWEIYPSKALVRIETLHEDGYKLYSEAQESGTVQSKVLAGFELEISQLFGGRS